MISVKGPAIKANGEGLSVEINKILLSGTVKTHKVFEFINI